MPRFMMGHVETIQLDDNGGSLYGIIVDSDIGELWTFVETDVCFDVSELRENMEVTFRPECDFGETETTRHARLVMESDL